MLLEEEEGNSDGQRKIAAAYRFIFLLPWPVRTEARKKQQQQLRWSGADRRWPGSEVMKAPPGKHQLQQDELS